MKTSAKLLLAAGLLSVAFTRPASALDIYITGSSAYRGAVTNAIGHLLDNPQAAFVAASAGTGSNNAVAGANQQLITGIWKGTQTGTTQGTVVNFHTPWTGSLAGLTVM